MRPNQHLRSIGHSSVSSRDRSQEPSAAIAIPLRTLLYAIWKYISTFQICRRRFLTNKIEHVRLYAAFELLHLPPARDARDNATL